VLALTRHQYRVLGSRAGLTVTEVAVIPDRSYTMSVKLEFRETWTRYELASGRGFQRKVGVVGTPVAPLSGDTWKGALGAVIKLESKP